MISVYTTEHLEGELLLVLRARDIAKQKLENAELRAMIAEILEVGGSVLHSVFVGGDEPKWTHECQRKHLLELSDVLKAAHKQITGGAL